MSDIQSPALKVVALAFNYVGRGLIRALALAAVGVVLILARRIVALVAYAIAEGLAPLISSVTKALVDRPRPPHELVHASGTSFPSGHATYAGVTCVVLVLLFTTRGRRWWSFAIGGICGMAWSRTYLQVHWLSDVTAGSILGVAVALIVFGGVGIPVRSRSRTNNHNARLLTGN
jgi:membrane-associated phospholipid phosphatase